MESAAPASQVHTQSAPALAFRGVFPILVTPFTADERLDLPSLERVVRFMAQAGMDGVTVLGVLGEANRLSDREREQVLQSAVRAAGTMPVVAGVSHPGSAACLEHAQTAQSLGARAVMIAPQREPVPNETRIYEHFERVASGCALPIVVQDHPASTQSFMSVELLARLVENLPQVQCIKAEHPPTPQKIRALRKRLGPKQIPLMQGLGALYGLFDLESGADGFMTGFAFPEVLQALTKAAAQNDSSRMRMIYARFLPLIVFEQQPGLAIRKAIYALRGWIRSPRVRHPAGSVDAETEAQLRTLLEWILPRADLSRALEL